MNTNNSRASTPKTEASADRRGLPDGASVSATFMSFMQPIFDALGNNREAWSSLATVAWTVWNSAVLDAVQGGAHLAEVRKSLHGSASFPLAEILIQRKRDAFPRHLWLVGECKFYDDVNGSPRLRVEARSAYPDRRTGETAK